MRSARESSKYYDVLYVADAPRKRDFLKVLLGRWTPDVRRIKRLTFAGVNRELKRAWTPGKLERQLYAESPLLAAFSDETEPLDPS